MSYQSISPGPRLCLWIVRNKIRFNREELLAPRTTPKLWGHPLSAVRDCLFNTFADTLHIGDRSSIRNLRTRHAVVTGTHLSRGSVGLQWTNKRIGKIVNLHQRELFKKIPRLGTFCTQSVNEGLTVFIIYKCYSLNILNKTPVDSWHCTVLLEVRFNHASKATEPTAAASGSLTNSLALWLTALTHCLLVPPN